MDRQKVARELVKIARELESARYFVLKKISLDGQEEDVAKGTLPKLNRWAKARGCQFVKDDSLFGGYWVDDDGTSYEFDIE